MVTTLNSGHQSGWTYLLILAAIGGVCLLVWLLGKLFPKGTGAAAGNALMQAEVFFRPSRQKVIEARQEKKSEEDAAGDPPEKKSLRCR